MQQSKRVNEGTCRYTGCPGLGGPTASRRRTRGCVRSSRLAPDNHARIIDSSPLGGGGVG